MFMPCASSTWKLNVCPISSGIVQDLACFKCTRLHCTSPGTCSVTLFSCPATLSIYIETAWVGVDHHLVDSPLSPRGPTVTTRGLIEMVPTLCQT